MTSGSSSTVSNKNIYLPISYSNTDYAYWLCPVGTSLSSGEMSWNRFGITKSTNSVTFQNLISEGMYILTIGNA